MATTRQLIKRKLVELDHKPPNVQVILQGNDQSVHKIFLLIMMELLAHVCTYSRDYKEHMTSQPANANMASDVCSAFHDNELEHLTYQLDKQSQELVNVTEQLRIVQLIMEHK